MKLAVTIHTRDIDDYVVNGADILVVGNHRFANRLVTSFELEDIKTIVSKAHTVNKEVYVMLNLIMHNSDIEDVSTYLNALKSIGVDAVIYGDIGVFQLAKKIEFENKLIYHPETLNTNYFDPLYWAKHHIKGLVISKEVTLEELKHTAKKSPIDLVYIGHGHLNMFHSRRPLIENFFKFTKEEYEEYINNRKLRLVEELRQESYPIFQDEHGTHIFREKPMSSYEEILEIKTFLDVFYIDGIFQSHEDTINTISKYHDIITLNDNTLAKQYATDVANTHDSGFLYKKTIYQK